MAGSWRMKDVVAGVPVVAMAGLLCCLNSMSQAPIPAYVPEKEILRQVWMGQLVSLPIYLLPLGVGLAVRGEIRATLSRWFTWPAGGKDGWWRIFRRGALAFLFLLAGVISLVAAVGPQEDQMVIQLLDRLPAGALVWLFLPFAVVVPVVEEMLFRGILVETGPARWSVWASAGCFALAHGVNGFLLPLFFFGVVLGLIAARQRTLVPGILFHALFNGLNLLLLFL